MNWERSRHVTERWFIEGTLELLTPTSLSNGDDDPLVDLPIVVDPLEGRALLTGASLAGALRAYLAEHGGDYAEALFGGARGKSAGAQSSLIVDDALGGRPRIELRDGVSIDPTTRTAKEKERYDRQLLAAGTTFDLSFELVIGENPSAPAAVKQRRQAEIAQMKAGLAAALYGLQQGDIRLGGRKRRGYGQCRVITWRAWRYELDKPEDARAWLAHGHGALAGHQAPAWEWREAQSGRGILDWPALDGVTRPQPAAPPFTLSATLAIDGAVLIRHGFESETGPDVAHLRSRRGNRDAPVMSGTSLAGVIRAQAGRIARTMAGPERQAEAEAFVGGMFGFMEQPRRGMTPVQRRRLGKFASRVTIDESEITGQPRDIVQTRVKIDRFTGGAFESALFAEQPAFGGTFTLKVALRPQTAKEAGLDNQKLDDKVIKAELGRRSEREVGLLLLVLKDLWTGFLPVGGSSSVGRGRLKGRSATIRYGGAEWTLTAAGDNGEALTVASAGDAPAERLNEYVTAFVNAMAGRV